ncbi:MAG: 16S rRNA (cytosine(1402)-N(4))-methyltransferase RsmH [Xanthomonadales bacterium]|nr:16S rRNA (cytosine(1402)-N(4))-methyltransferase RsmH [Xanthomonadales bacterium]
MQQVGGEVNPLHQPVMPAEVLEGLAIQSSGRYVDATFGRGGHSRAVLRRLSSEGRLLALDRDPQAATAAQALAATEPRLIFRRGRFACLKQAIEAAGWQQVDGILLDVGVSSPQLDQAERGFSFMREGPLDMRMDPESGESAADWLNRAEESVIADVLWRYGEERRSRHIARAIVAARQQEPLTTTTQLAAVIAACFKRREPGHHPATRSFQAIRIYMNAELDELETALHQAVDVLAPGGRLAVISFHSLEDRLVKQTLRTYSKPPPGGRRLPPGPQPDLPLRLVGKAQKASADELAVNPRARSAVLRVAERV